MPGVATSPATEAVLTMAPRFCCSMTGNTWRRPRKTPLTLTPITASNMSSSYSAVCAHLPSMPALLKKQSIRAVGVERRLHIILHFGRFGHIGRDEPRLAALLTDDPGGRLPSRRVAVDENDFGAALGKTERGGAADPVGAAGDQRDLAGKVQIHGVPPSISHC